MRRSVISPVLILLLGLVATACGASDQADAPVTATAAPTTTTDPVPSTPDAADPSTTVAEPGSPATGTDPAEAPVLELGPVLLTTDLSDPEVGGFASGATWSFGPSGLVASLDGDGTLGLNAAAVRTSADVSVSARFDLRTTIALDAAYGVACRAGASSGYRLMATSLTPGGNEFTWSIVRRDADGTEVLARAGDATGEAVNGLLDLSLACVSGPEGTHLTAGIGQRSLGSVTDPEPLDGEEVELHLTTTGQAGDLTVTNFSVYELLGA